MPNPAAILPIDPTAGGDFALPHGLGRTPTAAVPVPNVDGAIRLQPSLYDDTNVFLSASGPSLTGTLFVW